MLSVRLDRSLENQLNFLAQEQSVSKSKIIKDALLTVYNISQDEISHIRVIMKKYSDIPMDLADASLMYVANREKIKTIVSIDSDFDIYRTLKNKV